MKIVKSALIIILALIMMCSSMIIVAAETIAQDDETTVVTISDANGGTREYELAWKYKYENGHYYKRRWNYTLGEWYDPYWILVY